MRWIFSAILMLAGFSFGASLPIEIQLPFFSASSSASNSFCGWSTNNTWTNILTSAAFNGSVAATNSPADTTGSTLFVIAVSSYSADGGTVGPGSVPANTFIALNSQQSGVSGLSNQFFYCISPTTSNGQYFYATSSVSGSVGFTVYAFSCVGVPAFDAQAAGSFANSTSVQPGSVSPANLDLFISSEVQDGGGLTGPSGWSSVQGSGGGSPNTAYLISSCAQNPTWSYSTVAHRSAIMAAFKTNSPPAAGGFITVVSGGTTRNDFTGNVGMRIIPNVNMTVTQLGRYVVSGNSGTHTVLITDGACTTLATASVNTSGQTAGTFVYASITPVSLTAGLQYHIFSVESNGGDLFLNDDSTLTFNSTDAAINTAAFGSCSGAAAPNNCFGPSNFKYTIP